MSEPLGVHLFAEDVAHARFLQALVRRLALQQPIAVDLTLRLARGGRGAVLSEVQLAQRSAQGPRPDVLIVGVDANCEGDKLRREVQARLDRTYCPRQVVACPDPHVERWYLADPIALNQRLNASVTLPAAKCERDAYKQLLLNALQRAGHRVSLGGAEFADEIVEAMDFFRAGKNDASLKRCIQDLRAALKELV